VSYIKVKQNSVSRFSFDLVRGRQIATAIVVIMGFFISLSSLSTARALADGESPNHLFFYLSVFNKQGQPVEDLTQKNFEVFEDKKPQTITRLQFEKNSPISLGILIDISRDMGGERTNLALSWVNSLAGLLKSPDEIFINAFSDESQEVVDFISPEDYLEQPLDHLGTGGRAHTGLAVDLAMIKLREARNPKRALLFVSAGLDIAGPATLEHIARARYPIYALGLKGTTGITGTLDRVKSLNVKGSALRVYADQSGGNAIFVESAKEAENALQVFCSELKNQYLLEYLSSNPKRDGKLRSIEVKVPDADYQVRHLKKYQASRR
jgi:Ca-activated chloride channel homolog